MTSSDLTAICEEFSVEIVPRTVRVGYLQTQAAGTLERLISNFGKDHCRLVVMALTQTGNGHALAEPVFWAVSDVLRAKPDWIGSRLFDAMDGVNLMDFWGRAKVGGVVTAREHIAVLLYEHLDRAFSSGTTIGEVA